MESLLVEIPEAEFFLSVKGIGVISVAVILGETGGLSQYSHAEEVIKLAGLDLFEVSPGKQKGKVRISKRGRPLSFVISSSFLLQSRRRTGCPFLGNINI